MVLNMSLEPVEPSGALINSFVSDWYLCTVLGSPLTKYRLIVSLFQYGALMLPKDGVRHNGAGWIDRKDYRVASKCDDFFLPPPPRRKWLDRFAVEKILGTNRCQVRLGWEN